MLDIRTKEEMIEEKNRLVISKVLKGKISPAKEDIINKLKGEAVKKSDRKN